MIYLNDKNINMEESCVVTFGKFDGFHKGHQLLLTETVRLAREYGLPSVVCTFNMKNWKGGAYDRDCKLSTTQEKKILCEDFGVDILYEYPFDDEMANTEPLNFLESFVKNRLHARAVVVGEDWHFGSGRGGDVTLLKASQKLYRFEAVVLPKEKYGEREISSTWIRDEVKKGNMENANILLGYSYFLAGKVQHGQALGRHLECPTVNIIPEEDKLLPPFGVYDSKVRIGDRELFGVTNIGVRPTVSEEGNVTVETYILNFDEEIYGEELKVSLMHYERPEMRFTDVKELQKQLEQDIAAAGNFFGINNCSR